MSVVVACVIPAFEAAATIGAVAAGLRRALPEALIIAIDDGSSDDTAVVAGFACDRVLRLPFNCGKGAALRAGFAEALRLGADVVLTVDADGQHAPAYAPALVAAVADGADIAIGTRRRVRGSMPLMRRLSNRLSSAAVSACAGTRIADSQSGYRALRRRVLQAVAPQGDRYEFETDLLIQAARLGMRIDAVPVPTSYGPRSHFHPVRDARLVIATILRHGRAPRRTSASPTLATD